MSYKPCQIPVKINVVILIEVHQVTRNVHHKKYINKSDNFREPNNSGNITSLDNFALRLASDLRINKETIIKMQMSVSVALLKELMTFSINDRDTELEG